LQQTLEQFGKSKIDVDHLGTQPTLEAYFPELTKSKSSNGNGTESTTRVMFWYHPDYLGNVDLVTERDGKTYEFFTYNPWGEEMHQYNANTFGFASPYRFNSKEKDEESGLHYYGARYYQSKLSVWMSVDPLAHKTLEPYVFTGNNPIMLVDPDGRNTIAREELDLGEVTTPLREVTLTISGQPNGKTYNAQSYPSRDGVLYEVEVYTLTVSGTDNNGNQVSKEFDVLRFMPYLNKQSDNTGYGTISETPIMSGLADERNEPAHSYNPNYEIHNTSSPENGGIVIYGNFMIHDGPDDLSEFGWGAAGCMEICGKSGFENLKSTIHSLSGSSKPIEQGLVELAGAGKLMIHIEQAIRPTPKPI